LTLGDEEYAGSVGPANKLVGPGTALLWTADDDDEVGEGWVICAREANACAELPAAPANGEVGTATLPVPAGGTVTLECGAGYAKTGDFVCLDGAFSEVVCVETPAPTPGPTPPTPSPTSPTPAPTLATYQNADVGDGAGLSLGAAPTPAPTPAKVKGALAVTMSAEAAGAVAAAFADDSTRAAVETAFASSIADGLGMDEDLVTILSIAVASDSRRARRLQDASLEVEFEVETPAASADSAAADSPAVPVVSIADLDTDTFSSALTTSLAEAPGLEALPAVEVTGVVAEEVVELFCTPPSDLDFASLDYTSLNCTDQPVGSTSCTVVCRAGYQLASGAEGTQLCAEADASSAAYGTWPVCDSVPKQVQEEDQEEEDEGPGPAGAIAGGVLGGLVVLVGGAGFVKHQNAKKRSKFNQNFGSSNQEGVPLAVVSGNATYAVVGVEVSGGKDRAPERQYTSYDVPEEPSASGAGAESPQRNLLDGTVSGEVVVEV
jgi:hypothetical protein